jgi:hypothetical protein
MHEIALAHPTLTKIVLGAASGAGAAALADYHAFQTWKRWQDAITYDWGTATFRWFSGAVTGALMGAGLGAFL